MMPLVVLIGLAVVPALLLVLLRVNAALVFLSLCLGDVLVQFVGKDAVSIVAGASTSAYATSSTVKLVLLLAPAFLTMLFMIKTVKGAKRFFNALPAAGVGLLTALLVVPLLPPGIATNIKHSNLWTSTQNLQSAIVAGSTLICLMFLWTTRPKHEGKSKHH
jgi:hypothetical protein